MALPPGVVAKTVTLGIGTFFDGTVVSGRATVTAPKNVVHTTTNRPLYSSDMVKTFTDGVATFDLCPTDAPGLNRVDWNYRLKIEISGALEQPEVLYFLLPTAGPDVVDLDGLVTVPSSAGIPISVQAVTSVNGQTGDVTLTGSGGSIADASPTVKGVVMLTGDLGGTAASPTVPGLASKVNSSTYTAGITSAKDRAQHTGTQTASTISDFTAAVQAIAGSGGGGGTAPTTAALAADIGYDVWIVAGQSNASGTNTDYDTTKLDVTNDRVYAYSYFFPYNGTEPMVAIEPLQNGISPGSHFARWMTQVIPSNRRVLLVPLGAGGTSLGGTDVPRWDAALTGSLFDQMVTTTQTALSVAGPNARLGGVIWAQGENDASQGRTQAQYTTDLLNLIDFLRTQLSAPTLPFCIIGMVPEVIAGGGGYVGIDAAQRAIPAARRYTSYTAGVTGFGNGLHYTAAGQRRNGRNLIAGWTAAVANTSAPAGTYPLTLTRTGGSSTTLTNTVAPAITGTATTGQTLTVSSGAWTPAPDSYTYQWKRAGANISGATATTYVLVQADEGQAIACTVTAVKATYTNATATSNTVTPAAAGTPALTNSTLPTITGTATQGQVLTATNGTWSATPDSFTYVWKRAGTAISGATASTYTLVAGDVGSTITVTVTAVKAGYTSGTATSAATATVTAPAGGGATFTETWTGTDGAAWPAAWSIGGTATIQGNKGQLAASAWYGAAALGTGATGGTGDFDQTVTWTLSTVTGNTNVIVGAGDALSNGQPANGYTVGNTVLGTNNTNGAGSVGGVFISRLNAATSTNVAQGFPTITAGVGGFKTRIQRTGTTVRAKTWAADAAEPGTWTVTGTDAAPLTGITLKPWLSQAGGSVTITADFDDLTFTAS